MISQALYLGKYNLNLSTVCDLYIDISFFALFFILIILFNTKTIILVIWHYAICNNDALLISVIRLNDLQR
jgi:hypothetical protein